MTYVIAQPCVDVKDRACVTECPVDYIYEGERTLCINPSECVDCHACEPVCPVEAIFYERDIAVFTIGKEEAADADLWFPSWGHSGSAGS
ncbi:ferredoxin [Streptomyces spinoverrucosus]|uniref:Ferredoxin n=1 Tax=Streptomyces spinoverrucosus TaxID=284043 RepID=A0A4Y3VH49_9ACTN|nr:ferredoxin family protein [Streptomyces spinoverrucosus]GEC04999.1 ferredoxin [Streptomyces spinoverrucosus]GHB96487.1 ferredoxin [Streptomyces spinoverrucosus]